MSIKYLNWAWNQNLDTPLQKLILVKLGDNADDSGRAFPSLETIAKFTSCNEKTVRRNITKLEELTLLTVLKLPARAGHLRNEYLLNIEIVLHFDVPDTESTTGHKVQYLPDTESTGYRTESPDNPQSLTPSINHQVTNSVIDDLFEQFWLAGLPKVNKKKALTAFKVVMKRDVVQHSTMTAVLIDDVHGRLAANQFGFSKMHPTTYLNGERWNDEITTTVNQSPDLSSTDWAGDKVFDPTYLES